MDTAEQYFVRFRASPQRVGCVARHTLAEALRLRLTVLLALVGAMLVLMALRLREFNFGHAELKFISDFGLGAIGLMGTLLAALGTAHLFFSDSSGGVVGCLLTRALRRWEYVAGKLIGIMALLALFVAALVVVLACVIALRERDLGGDSFPLSRLLQAGALVWLKLTLVAAMTLIVCAYAGSMLFAALAGLLLALVAQLRPLADPQHGLAWLRVWPNLGLFDTEPVLNGLAMPLPYLLVYWIGYMVLFTGLAAYVCHQRDY
jgi:hypothetical protein